MRFFYNTKGVMEYRGGKEDWADVASIADLCGQFTEDDEDEQVADSSKSCYNCRYRRWTSASFMCCKPK